MTLPFSPMSAGRTPNKGRVAARNSRGPKTPKRGRKPLFDPAIFEERFNTVERLFGWEHKFRRLLLWFDRLSKLHYAFRTLAYTMVNLRHFCRNQSSNPSF